MSPNNELNIDQFKKYLSGTMSAEEKGAFERKLELDPFAKEALEGFTQMEQPNEMVGSINSIEEKIGLRTGIEKAKTPIIPIRRILSIAAVLVAVIGGGFLVSQLLQVDNTLAEKETSASDEEITDNKKKESVSSIEQGYVVYNDTVTLNFSDNIGGVDRLEIDESNMELVELEEEPGIAEIVEDEEETFYNNDIAAAPSIVEEDQLEELPLAELASNKEENNGDLDKNGLGSADLQSGTVTSTTKAPSNDEYRNNTESIALSDASAVEQETLSNQAAFDNGLKSYQQSEYNDAISLFNKSISDGNKVAESNYYLGLSYMNVNKSTKAMKAFDNVINSPSSLGNNAKWYKASILLSKGKNAEAKALLEDLVNSNSSFKQSAQEKLNNL